MTCLEACKRYGALLLLVALQSFFPGNSANISVVRPFEDCEPVKVRDLAGVSAYDLQGSLVYSRRLQAHFLYSFADRYPLQRCRMQVDFEEQLLSV